MQAVFAFETAISVKNIYLLLINYVRPHIGGNLPPFLAEVCWQALDAAAIFTHLAVVCDHRQQAATR